MQVVWVTLYACYGSIDVTIYITCENHPPSPTPAGWSNIKIVIGSCVQRYSQNEVEETHTITLVNAIIYLVNAIIYLIVS